MYTRIHTHTYNAHTHSNITHTHGRTHAHTHTFTHRVKGSWAEDCSSDENSAPDYDALTYIDPSIFAFPQVPLPSFLPSPSSSPPTLLLFSHRSLPPAVFFLLMRVMTNIHIECVEHVLE